MANNPILLLILGGLLGVVFTYITNKLKKADDYKDAIITDLVNRVSKLEKDTNEAWKQIRGKK